MSVPYVVVAVTLVALMGVTLVRSHDGLDSSGPTVDLLAVLTTAFGLVTGFFQLERWRIQRLTKALWASAGGFLAATMVASRRLLPASGMDLDPSAVGSFTLACTVTLMLVSCWIALGPEVDPRVRPAIAAAVVTAMAGTLAATFFAFDLELPGRAGPGDGPAGELAIAGGWTLAGVLLTIRGRQRPTATTRWLGLFAFGLAGAEIVIAIQADHGLVSHPARTAMVTLGTLGLAFASERDLRVTITTQASEIAVAREAMHAVSRREHRAHAFAAERAHEALNAIAAIDSTIRTLDAYRDRLPDNTREHLAAGMVCEIARLQRLVDVDDHSEPATVFLLAEAFAPVVTMARTQGLQLETDVRPDVEVLAARDATVEVVQNLLINAHRHAGGAGVVLQAGTDGARAIVRVLDRGPGVPADRREAIFERGWTGDPDGRGLGLHVSRRLVEAQGGTLTVRGRMGGGTMSEFDLPLAPSGRRRAPRLDQRQEVGHAQDAGHR